MMKIVVLSDGNYGDRAYNTIKKEFDTDFIRLESPKNILLDEEEEKLTIPKNFVRKIEEANILISYISHPDLVLNIVNRFSDKVDWIIIASWKGKGLKKQLESKGNVTCPYVMCELEKNGNAAYDKFTEKIGKPAIELILSANNINKIEDINVIRTSPCGSTYFVAQFIANKYKGCDVREIDIGDLARETGLKLQHFPCRAGKIRLFAHDEESKKQLASSFHADAFKEAFHLF